MYVIFLSNAPVLDQYSVSADMLSSSSSTAVVTVTRPSLITQLTACKA